MTKQLLLFDEIIPPCRNCNGKARWEDAADSTICLGQKLELLACTRCSFTTKPMVHSCRKYMVSAWIEGVPCLVSECDRERYYKLFWRKHSMPGARYMGHAGYMTIGIRK